MSVQRAIARLCEGPLLLRPSTATALLRTAERPDSDAPGTTHTPGTHQGLLSRSGRCAVVSVDGLLMHRPGPLERLFLGAIDYAEIADAIFAGADHANSEAVVIRLNTPGGTTAGISEVIDAIDRVRAAGMPVVAVVNEQACSAGHWIASRCDQLLATPSSMLGSIGTMMIVLDSSRRYETEGLRAVVIRSGELKAAGAVDGDPLTEEQHANYQRLVTEVTRPFAKSVADQTGIPLGDVLGLKGRVLPATEAERLGYCDLVPSLRVALELVEDQLAGSPAR